MEYTLHTAPTLMGHLSHTVTTDNSEFSFVLFEKALDVDFEPSRTYKGKGVYEVEFIADVADCFATIQSALLVVGGVA